MTYLRSLFFNFLAVFFIDNVNPYITIEGFEHVPNIGADILFSAVVGFLNSLIFPIMVLFEVKINFLRIAIVAILISFLSFGIIGVFDFGIRATSLFGVVSSALFVSFVATFSNYLEYRHSYKKR